MTWSWLGTDLKTWAGICLLLFFSAGIYLGWCIHLCGRTSSVLYSLIAAQVLFLGQVLGIMLILGWLGVLYPAPLAIANGLIAVAVYGLGVRPQWRKCVDCSRAFFHWVRSIRFPLWSVLLAILMVVILIRNIFWGWFLPPYLRDDAAYHLAIMGNIVQGGAIRYFPSPAERISDFPINSELLQAWNFEFLGLDKLVDLAFLPTVLIGGLAMYGVCRRFGVSRRASVVGWAVFAFTPAVFLQQVGSYNDAWMASLFICGIYLVLAGMRPSFRRSDAGTAVLAGICSGLILGTKFSGMLCSMSLGVFFLASGFSTPPESDRPQEPAAGRRPHRGILLVVSFLLITIFYGAYPLIRNAIVKGNPLAPVEVKIGNEILWPGKPVGDFLSIGSEDLFQKTKSWWGRIATIWFERYHLIYDWENGGAGPVWVFLGLPGALYFVWRGLRRRQGLAIWIALLSFVILLFTPAQWRPRYILPLLLVCGLGTALLVDALAKWPRRIVIGELILSAAFVTVASLRPAPMEADKAVALAFHSTDLKRSAAFVHPRNEFYGWVDEYTLDKPAVIAYGRWVDAYPLFGSDLRNRVIGLSAYTAEDWKRQLSAEGVELVVVSKNSPEETWTRDSGEYIVIYEYESWAVWEKKNE
jgi:hypothetical protein